MKSIILGMIDPYKRNMTVGGFPDFRTGMIHVRKTCNSCEKHIVSAAKSVEGVKKADWSKNSNVLVVEYDPQKTSLSKIECTIAEAGHDTPNYKGIIKYYNYMPKCCQYNEELKNGI